MGFTAAEKRQEKQIAFVAKLSPAYEAYRGQISRFLGLHHLFVGNLGHWLFCFLFVAGSAACFTLAAYEDTINPNHVRHCCYPPGTVHGTLGSCTDPAAQVHSATSKRECPPHGAFHMVFLFAGLALLLVNFIYVSVTTQAFLDKAADELVGLRSYVRIYEKENPNCSKYQAIRQWIREHPFAFYVVWLPESFFFGQHLQTLGRTALFYLYNLFLWGGALFAVFFFTTSLPLDNAWRCYPKPTLRATNMGRCDIKNSTAFKRFHVRADEHLDVFWVTLGVWVASHAIVLSLYLYTVFDFKRLYAKHILTKLNKIKDA